MEIWGELGATQVASTEPACASSVAFDVGGILLERGMGKTGFPHYEGLESLILPLVGSSPRMRGFCGWGWSSLL